MCGLALFGEKLTKRARRTRLETAGLVAESLTMTTMMTTTEVRPSRATCWPPDPLWPLEWAQANRFACLREELRAAVLATLVPAAAEQIVKTRVTKFALDHANRDNNLKSFNAELMSKLDDAFLQAFIACGSGRKQQELDVTQFLSIYDKMLASGDKSKHVNIATNCQSQTASEYTYKILHYFLADFGFFMDALARKQQSYSHQPIESWAEPASWKSKVDPTAVQSTFRHAVRKKESCFQIVGSASRATDAMQDWLMDAADCSADYIREHASLCRLSLVACEEALVLPGSMHCLVAEAMLIRFSQANAAEPRYEEEEPVSLAEYLDLRVHRLPSRSCLFEVRPRRVGSSGVPDRDDVRAAAFDLALALEKGTEGFAYALTPDRAYDTVDSRRERGTRLSGDVTAGAIEFRETASSSELTEQPRIVAWGGARLRPNDLRSGRFGWVFLPERAADRDRLAREQQKTQSLEVYLSVPSWWNALGIQVRACWVDEPLTTAIDGREPSCGDNSTSVLNELVRLPSVPIEISRKLGFEIIEEPYALGFPDDRMPSLEAYKPGEIVIEGGRLWKSPRVVLGHQTTERIEVLPNMNGLVVKFQCVEWPISGDKLDTSGSESKNSERQEVRTTLRVFTSEGATEPISVRVWRSKPAGAAVRRSTPSIDPADQCRLAQVR